MLYPVGAIKGEAYTVYTNLTTAGAMRAYGIPQSMFALESHIDDICRATGLDPITIRKQNMMKLGYVDGPTTITCHSTGLAECIDRGSAYLDYDRKRAEYAKASGSIRRGVGMSIFCYKAGSTHQLETSSVRMLLNQDGSLRSRWGDRDRPGDTVFSMMAAETIGVTLDKITSSVSRTPTSPPDSGAYGSRQSYVSGMAVKTAEPQAQDSRVRRLHAEEGPVGFGHQEQHDRPHQPGQGVAHCRAGGPRVVLQHGKLDAHRRRGEPPLHRQHLRLRHLLRRGRGGHPPLPGQGGGHHQRPRLGTDPQPSDRHGAGAWGDEHGPRLPLSNTEFDPKTGRMLNDNLLDYKLMTAIDTPDLHGDFVEAIDPTGPYGNKALGEPPTIPVAPAIRNAVLNATGVGINSAPLHPERLFEEFRGAGLIK